MLKHTIDALYQQITNRPGAPVLTAEKQAEILQAAKNCRSVDYVCNFVIPSNVNQIKANPIVTRAGWLFILTGIQLWDRMAGAVEWAPRLAVEFENIPAPRMFQEKTDFDLRQTVPARLCVGCEGNDKEISNWPFYHYEEAKNVFFVLPERAIINTTIWPYIWLNNFAATGFNGAVLYSGLEINLEFLKESN